MNPMQPLVLDCDGRACFRMNLVVRYLLRQSGLSLNEIVDRFKDDGADDDLAQLYQLIGYSVTGFTELSFIPDNLKERALDAEEALKR